MSHPIKSPRKLIEVALPLDAINAAAAREKSIRHGHPSTLHLWWARRPLAAARAVIFSQLVNDPSWKWEMEHAGEVPPGHLKASWAASRKRLFNIIEQLVLWENTTNEPVLEKARAEIRKSWRETCELNKDHPQAAELFNPDKMPGLHDPFAGGGSIPLEAQRLGLEAFASDLNPVAVLINKAMIEIPPKFAGMAPVNPQSQKELRTVKPEWKGARGLAEDVRYYGAWMREQAQQRIGHLYPPVKITAEMAQDRPDLKPLVGQKLTVIAWLWARTVKSPNPAFRDVDVPLATSFVLSSQEGRDTYVQPVVRNNDYSFTVRIGKPPADAKNGTKSGGSGSAFFCLLSKTPMEFAYLREEAKQGRMGQKLMAVVVEGQRGRVYLPPTDEIETIANRATPHWQPTTLLPDRALGFRVQEYGMVKWSDLFSPRQLVTLANFSDLVTEVRERVHTASIAAEIADDNVGLDAGGLGATAYAEAISVYLAFAASKSAMFLNTLSRWRAGEGKTAPAFGRQAIAMVWDYAEVNPFAGAGGDFFGIIEGNAKTIEGFDPRVQGMALQLDAQTQHISSYKHVSTDPPYYDNIGYADLSDFFYVWLRPTLRSVFPSLFATLAVPKAEELIATPYRHNNKLEAEAFFLKGMTQAMSSLAQQAHPAAPITIYYAFKQSETGIDTGTASTGWETFLDAVVRAGLALTGTWPMRTEGVGRLVAKDTNSLASSIILVCRPRSADAFTISRRTFQRELNQVLPEALDEMTKGSGDNQSPVAPVDLSQAIIGPGMAVFSKYAAVLEADGRHMSVKTALQLINRFLAEDDFDADTQFSLQWFEQHGWKEGRFGEADTLARAKGTSVEGVRQAGVLVAEGGVVRLLRWADYPTEWKPTEDVRLPVWEVLHQMIRVFKQQGETGTGAVLAAVASKTEAARQLAYRLYTLCERAGWAEDARAYNEIITSWSAIETSAATQAGPQRATLFDI